jgi:RsiW-degrading membrane proteinase PrsW (M82 family)
MDYFTFFIYIIFGILPSLVWLSFYLRRDVNPEPKLMILKIFSYGMLASLPAIFLETAIFSEFSKLNFSSSVISILNIFLGIALIEESLKFLSMVLGVFKNPEFDEPVDAMIYMITAALGFAAAENVLIIFQLKPLSEIFEVSLFRFLGATFLHALASGISGFFIGLSFFNPKVRQKLVPIGLFLAILLHGFYNFYIMKGERSLKLLIPLFGLFIAAIFVSFGFKRLRKLTKI